MMPAVTLTRVLRHPPHRVWRALTDSEILADWLFPNDFSPVVGEGFTFKCPAQPHWNGVVNGTVLVLEPPHRLAIRWQAEGIDGAPPLDTVVTFTLRPSGTGTHLQLEQDGFLPGQVRNIAGAQAGWPRLLTQLELRLQHLSGDETCKPA